MANQHLSRDAIVGILEPYRAKIDGVRAGFATDRIVTLAGRYFAELGRTLTPTEVGSSADVALAAETGTPSIDGFGIEGANAHT